jgi:type I restriction-modification system DNA methylase subunit
MNQILFYFVYSKNAKGNTLPSMHKIKHPQELSEYFEEIREVDFAPIFDIDVSSKIPPTPEIIKRINDVIDVLLEALRIHCLKHDLYGRLIGRSLPTETRELLASYYTKPSPARLMAALTITEPYQTVWDAACGSGTLLVAAYDRKKMLYHAGRRSLESDEDLAKLHARFVEEDLTGTDIMAFACHLASLNLAAQNLAVSTNSSRVCRMNSLRIDKLPVEAQEAYGDTYRVLAPVSLAQKTIHEFEPKKKREVKPKTILLTKVNCVLINPPFTKLSRLPTQVKKQLGLTSRRFLGEGRMPLWVHFLHLTDRMLLDGGKLGAIVPISLFHGKDTQKLREFSFNNYRIEYVIKPASGDTFSEDSDYGDLIFIARKAKPDPTHKIKFVFFKDPGRRYSLVDIDHVVSIITTSVEHGVDTEDISMYEIEQTKLANELDNLMPYLFTSDSNLRKKLGKWVDEIRKSESIQMLSVNRVQKGYQFRPKDTARKALFIRRLSDSRVRNALQYFERVEGDKLVYFTKGGDRTQTIPLSMLTKTFRSVASVDKIEITELYDLVLRSKAKSNSRGACLFLAHRFRLNSSETFATAFYSSAPLVSTEAITMYRCEDVAAKILSLYFNSVFYLIQLMVLSKQATYGFIEMTRLDFGRVFLPRLSAISDKDTKIMLELFEKLRKQKLDSIMEQLRTASNYRLEIDGAFARILNLNIGRRELPELYRNLADELSRM